MENSLLRVDVDEEVSFRKPTSSTPRSVLATIDGNAASTPDGLSPTKSPLLRTVEKPSAVKTLEEPTPVRQLHLVESANSILDEIAGLSGFPTTSPYPRRSQNLLSALMPEVNTTHESLEDFCVLGLEARDAPPHSPVPMKQQQQTSRAGVVSPPVSVEEVALLTEAVEAVEAVESTEIEPESSSSSDSQPLLLDDEPTVPVVDTCCYPSVSSPLRSMLSSSSSSSSSVSSTSPVPPTPPASVPTPKEAPLTAAAKAKANRRASMGLCLSSEYSYHEPIYSQAEMDAALENAQQSAQQQQAAADLQKQVEAFELRALTAEHEVSTLRTQVEKSMAELQAERAASVKDREDAAMLKVQTKAMAHRLAMIDSEAQTALNAAKSETAAMVKQLEDTQSNHAAGLLEHRKAILLACEADKEALTAKHLAELQALQEEKAKLIAELAEVPEKLSAAEARGKQYVYKKVEKQFEEGNKEFIKVKRELSTRLEETQRALWGVLKAVPDCDVARSDVKVERTDVEASVEADKAIKWVAAIQAECASLKALTVTLGESNENDRVAHTTAFEASQQGHARELSEVKETMRSTIMTLECSLQKAEALVATLQQELSTSEALLTAARFELQETKVERDAQMTMVAKLCTSQQNAEEALEACKAECAASEARCVQLRQMNEEVMSMLEANYAK